MPFPVDEKFIRQAEEKLGVTFPASFRFKMIRENGGHVETPPDGWDLYPFLDSSDRKRLGRTCNDIVRETANARKWQGFPPAAIAIGHNGGGDKLILQPNEENPAALEPAVLWWDHETGEVLRICDDFEELCER